MTRIHGRWFSIDSERLEALAAATGLTLEGCRQLLIDTPWIEARDHQRWLDTADLMDIGNWLLVFAGSDR